MALETFLADCTHSKEEEECVIRSLGECSTKYKISSQFYPSNNEELQQYCRSNNCCPFICCSFNYLNLIKS